MSNPINQRGSGSPLNFNPGDKSPTPTITYPKASQAVVKVIRPEADSVATGQAKKKIEETRSRPGRTTHDKEDDAFANERDTSLLSDIFVVGCGAVCAVAALTLSAPVWLTAAAVATTVALAVDVVQHRSAGDQSSLLDRPGSILKACAVGVGAGVATLGSTAYLALGAAIAVGSEAAVDDAGASRGTVDGIITTVKDLWSWVPAAIALATAWFVTRRDRGDFTVAPDGTTDPRAMTKSLPRKRRGVNKLKFFW